MRGCISLGARAPFLLRTLLCVALVAATFSSTLADEPQRITGTCMGTSHAVSIADDLKNFPLQSLEQQVSDEFERIEQIFSLYRPHSELSHLNAAPANEWIAVSTDLLAVTKRSLNLARQANGAFDPSIGPLMRLWRLRQVSIDWSPPSAAALAETRRRIGFQHVETRDDPPAIRKGISGIELDLNALVEGWAIDRVTDLLRNQGLHNALVELGGEFRAFGHKTNGQPWKIGLENPLDPNSLYATATLTNSALATSGNYRQTIEHHGRHFGHILDARTGAPVDHNLLSVSVLAPDALTADGWATALMTLGPTEGIALAQKQGLAASFALRVGSELHIELTPAATGQIMLVVR
jgi:thiamine biosynthesis lipoprotein